MCSFEIRCQQISYVLPNGQVLIEPNDLNFQTNKIGLIGANGCGKSTLLKLIIGKIKPTTGVIQSSGDIVYRPQNLVFNPGDTVAELFAITDKLAALQRIEQGSVAESDYEILAEDWLIAEKAQASLDSLGLNHCQLATPLSQLSGGELTRLNIAKGILAQPDVLLLDEPTNNLDSVAKQQLMDWLVHTQQAVIIASHDRELLAHVTEIVEIEHRQLTRYGGNYALYHQQKLLQQQARRQQLQTEVDHLQSKRKTLQQHKQRREQGEARGQKSKKSQIAAKGYSNKMDLKGEKERAENTQGRIKKNLEPKIEKIGNDIQQIKQQLFTLKPLHFDIQSPHLGINKTVITCVDLCFSYPGSDRLLINRFNWTMRGPERVALVGNNGCGKSTLIKLLLKQLTPKNGTAAIQVKQSVYLDQALSILESERSILQNMMRLHDITEQQARSYLATFQYRGNSVEKLIQNLSGGEKLKAALACTLSGEQVPQLLILDEPTNHLDLTSIEYLETVLKNYQGALLVVSHDQVFLANIGVVNRIRV